MQQAGFIGLNLLDLSNPPIWALKIWAKLDQIVTNLSHLEAPMKNAEIARRRTDSISRGVGVQTEIYVDRALNSEVWDVEGKRYIDFAAGIAVVNTGHCHPRVMAAVTEQMSRFTHTCHQVLPYENYVRLAERLNAAVPGDFAKKTVFVTTGAEAVENAVKVARIATGRNAIIAFGGAFQREERRQFFNLAIEPLQGRIFAAHLAGEKILREHKDGQKKDDRQQHGRQSVDKARPIIKRPARAPPATQSH